MLFFSPHCVMSMSCIFPLLGNQFKKFLPFWNLGPFVSPILDPILHGWFQSLPTRTSSVGWGKQAQCCQRGESFLAAGESSLVKLGNAPISEVEVVRVTDAMVATDRPNDPT